MSTDGGLSVGGGGEVRVMQVSSEVEGVIFEAAPKSRQRGDSMRRGLRPLRQPLSGGRHYRQLRMT